MTATIATGALAAFATFATGDGVRHAAIVGTPLYIAMLAGLVLMGGTMLTLYSLLLAHAMDRTLPVYVASGAVTMLFVFTIGGIAGPLMTSALSAVFGDTAMGGACACDGRFCALHRLAYQNNGPGFQSGTNPL